MRPELFFLAILALPARDELTGSVTFDRLVEAYASSPGAITARAPSVTSLAPGSVVVLVGSLPAEPTVAAAMLRHGGFVLARSADGTTLWNANVSVLHATPPDLPTVDAAELVRYRDEHVRLARCSIDLGALDAPTVAARLGRLPASAFCTRFDATAGRRMRITETGRVLGVLVEALRAADAIELRHDGQGRDRRVSSNEVGNVLEDLACADLPVLVHDHRTLDDLLAVLAARTGYGILASPHVMGLVERLELFGDEVAARSLLDVEDVLSRRGFVVSVLAAPEFGLLALHHARWSRRAWWRTCGYVPSDELGRLRGHSALTFLTVLEVDPAAPPSFDGRDDGGGVMLGPHSALAFGTGAYLSGLVAR